MYFQVMMNLILCLYCGLYLFLTWKMKKYQVSKNKTMEIISQLPLGQKEKIMLVKVENRKILLGVTATQVNILIDMSDDVRAQEISMSELTSEIEAMMNQQPSSRNIQ